MKNWDFDYFKMILFLEDYGSDNLNNGIWMFEILNCICKIVSVEFFDKND